MADNVSITPGSGNTVAADEVIDGTLGTVKVQYVKIMDGALDGTTKAVVNSNGLKIDGSAVTQPISAATLPLPTGASTEATLALIKAKTDNLDVALSTRTKPADSQTITGTIAATQSGTWTVQPGNTANTTAWKVDGSAVTQPVIGAQSTAAATLGSLNAAVTLAVGGQQTIGFTAVNTSLTATLTAEMSFDNAVTWAPVQFLSTINYSANSNLGFAASSSTIWHHIVSWGGMTHVRVRASAYTSGSTAAVLYATHSANSSPLIYGKDNTNQTIWRPFLCDSNGALITAPLPSSLIISATAATGVAVTATLPASASNFHYISDIQIVKYFTTANAASATPLVVTTTNLPGSLAFSFGQPLGTIGTTDIQELSLEMPVKSSVINTATTIVCPATTGIIWRVNVYYNTAP